MSTILVDMDSIVADFYFGILDAYEAETGDRASRDAIDQWDAKLPNGKSLYAYFSAPGFFRSLRPVPGALEFIRAAKAEHDVLIVTAIAGLGHAPGEKLAWLSEHLPDFDHNHVIFAKRKDRVLGDVLIDDHPTNCAAFLKSQPRSCAIGIAYPYNINNPGAFTHLAPDYLNFEAAWREISRLVLR